MSDILASALLGQYRAALSTLEQVIDRCPEPEWDESHGDYPFSQVVFHTLFFADYYLHGGQADFREQGFHRDNPSLFQDYEELEWREPRNRYDRSLCIAYLEFCFEKCEAVLSRESLAVLNGPSGIDEKPFSRAELHVYTIRHIQHHAAQLGLRLQAIDGQELGWVSSGRI